MALLIICRFFQSLWSRIRSSTSSCVAYILSLVTEAVALFDVFLPFFLLALGSSLILVRASAIIDFRFVHRLHIFKWFFAVIDFIITCVHSTTHIFRSVVFHLWFSCLLTNVIVARARCFFFIRFHFVLAFKMNKHVLRN